MTDPLRAPASLLVGPAGSGKTASLVTQLLGGLEVFVIVTEPDGVASLLDRCHELKIPIDKLHWTTCMPTAAGFEGLEAMIKGISSMDQKQLADQRDMGKSDFREAGMRFLRALKDFPCERTGKYFGSYTDWDDTRSLNIDGLTGWSHIAWGCTVGYKPTANPGEWGIAQNFIGNMLLKINTDRKCYFNLIAHVEKEMDEMVNVKRIMVSTIGSKLAPKIPTFFSEVILTKRQLVNNQALFTWSTIDQSADLKNRALPVGVNLEPDFRQIISVHNRRKLQAFNDTSNVVHMEPARPSLSPVLPPAPMKPAT